MQLKKTNPEPNHEAFQKTNVVEVMQKTFPKYKQFEDAGDLLRRAAVIDEFLTEFLRANPLQGEQKHAIVCHSMIMATLTSAGADPADKYGLKDYTWPANCQLLPYDKI